MSNLFANRIENVPRSFIREILKFTQDRDVISFAGGLPNPDFFPVKEISDAAVKVMREDGSNVLQYSTSEGYLPLRKYISTRYKEKKGLVIPPEDIIITSGAQQAIALLCKTFLNNGEHVVIEKPAYLGAIQAISFYEPVFHGIELLDDGLNTSQLEEVYENYNIKLFYSVPNFQNPSGITYSGRTRHEVAEVLSRFESVFIEDDPYFDIRFEGESLPSIKSLFSKNVVLTGSFSKIVSPGFRIGWVAADSDLIDKIILSKQASDLHTSYFSQRVLYRYLHDNDLGEHIRKICDSYAHQKNCMIQMIEKYFPEDVKCTNPRGGMFLWVTLPEYLSSAELLKPVLQRNVAFVPGKEFYTDGGGLNKFRLNYTNSNEEKIEKGIRIIGELIEQMLLKHYEPGFDLSKSY
jgi:2-aminoadipate transaminase